MALSDLSFKLYNDDLLTSTFSGTLQLTHESDLSDGAQDFVKYFGSTVVDRQLQTSTSPGVGNITLTPTYILPDWAVVTAYSLGDSVIPTTPNGYRYECTTAGTSHATTEPTWPTSISSTVADGTVVWTCIAEDRPITEIKLATSSVGLDSATGGAALSLGTSVDSGVANAVEVHIRITNTIETVSSTFGTPEIGININSVQENDV
jgi:hypothetical protein